MRYGPYVVATPLGSGEPTVTLTVYGRAFVADVHDDSVSVYVSGGTRLPCESRRFHVAAIRVVAEPVTCRASEPVAVRRTSSRHACVTGAVARTVTLGVV